MGRDHGHPYILSTTVLSDTCYMYNHVITLAHVCAGDTSVFHAIPPSLPSSLTHSLPPALPLSLPPSPLSPSLRPSYAHSLPLHSLSPSLPPSLPPSHSPAQGSAVELALTSSVKKRPVSYICCLRILYHMLGHTERITQQQLIEERLLR